METVVRIRDVQVRNLKNVRQGNFTTSSTFETITEADIIGFYGQNGSGKTAIVEAFSLLKNLLSTPLNRGGLPGGSKVLLYYGEDHLQLKFDFLIENQLGQFWAKYEVTLKVELDRLQVLNEVLSYRENSKGKRFKELISKQGEVLKIRNSSTTMMSEDDRVTMLVANKMANKSHTSFIFREELEEVLKNYLDENELEIVANLSHDFVHDLHVIDNVQYGLLIANLIMPFSIHLENKRGNIPTEMQDTMLLPKDLFETIMEVITQTNIVLKTIIPGLQINVHTINEQKLRNGEDGIRIEFLSKRGAIELPLRYESEGILKMISILSTLIAVFNNPNACVVIDELDAGVFEYLLGELLIVLNEGGKGQLFFTSHNLRILEVLPSACIWFTTTNEEQRYIQLKGVKKLNNVRDVYLRAVQLGGQDETLYDETSLFDIKRSFRRAGIQSEQ